MPGIHENVTRHTKIHIHYFDENWVEHDEDIDTYLARVIQHENDHLDGIVYIDRGDPEFATKVTEKMKQRLEKAKKKEEEKAKKAKSIAAKLAAKEARKNK